MHAETSPEIICAAESDQFIASDIMIEAAEWLTAKGMTLWKLEELTPERIKPAIDRGELHLAKRNGEAVGTVTFQWEDKLFWPDVPSGEAAYIHRLAVRRSVAGQGIARGMIDWAKEKARAASRSYLRLDCDAQRHSLCAYYEAQGFIRHSEKIVGPFYVARYELPLHAI